jgi:hypothetical protein
MFEVSVLRINQEPGRRGERRGLGLVGQPAESEGTAEAHRAVEDLAGEFRDAGELGGAAAQDNASLRLRREGGILKPVPDHLKNLLDAMPHDIRYRGAGYDLWNIPFVVARRWHGHQLSRVGPAGQYGAI